MLKRLTLLIIMALLAPSLFGEDPDLASWFRTDAKARAYRDVEGQISETFDAARGAELPLWILMEKLREGAAKGVRADRLSSGLRAEVARLAEARDILARGKVAIADRKSREGTLKSVSIALLSGLSSATIEEMFTRAVPPARGPQDAVAACAAVIPVREGSRLAEADIRRLGAALLASRLPSGAFKSVASFFVKAGARGVREQDILDAMVLHALESGGGLVQMEDELRLYLKRRDSR